MPVLDGPVLNSDEAAKYCGLRGGGQSMRTHKYKGTGPTWHRLGAILVYYPADLDTWIAAKEKPVAATTGQNKTTDKKFVRGEV